MFNFDVDNMFERGGAIAVVSAVIRVEVGGSFDLDLEIRGVEDPSATPRKPEILEAIVLHWKCARAPAGARAVSGPTPDASEIPLPFRQP